MPVLLTREGQFEAWLSGAPAEALALAREYPPRQMRIVQEDFKKQDLLAAAAWQLLGGWPRLKAAPSLRQPLQEVPTSTWAALMLLSIVSSPPQQLRPRTRSPCVAFQRTLSKL